MWTDDWIGHPYRLKGRGPEFDCMGLWLALRAARGMSVPPDPACTQASAITGRVVDRMRPDFARVGDAIEGDLILYRMTRTKLHVGYALDARDMLHIDDTTPSSRIDAIRHPAWAGLIEGIYRYDH